MARRKNHTATYMTIALIMIVATLGILFKAGVIQSGLGSVLSLNEVSFTSNDPAIGGKAWILNWVQNGQSQYVSGSASASQIKDGSTQAKYGISLTSTNTKQSCEYKINQQNSFIKRVQINNLGNFYLSSNTCYNDCGSGEAYIKGLSCYCIKYTNDAQLGSIEHSSLNFETTLAATINGKTYSGIINNFDQNSVWLGSNNEIQASWSGNLVSGEVCPQADSGQKVSAIYMNGVWKLIDSVAYNDFVIFDKSGSGVGECIKTMSGDSVAFCQSKYNNLASLAESSKSFIAVGGSVASTSGTLANGKVSIQLAKQIQYPSFTARIKADILGVVVPVSKPQIISSDSDCFQTGLNGNVLVTIKNAGDYDASFTASLTCPSPFSQTGGATTEQFAKGETKQVNIPITGTASKEVTDSCTINVYDRENPNNKVSAQQKVCVQPIILCTPEGSVRCAGANNEVKEKCVGSGWVTIAGDNSCIAPNKCELHPELCKNVCAWYDPTCMDWKTALGLFIAFIVFVASWIFTYPFFKGMLTNNTAAVFTALIVGILAGGVTGFFVYKTIWIAIGGGIVWTILMGLLSKFGLRR